MNKLTKKKQILITMLRIAGLMVGMLALLILSLDWPLYALVIWIFWMVMANSEFIEVRRAKSSAGQQVTFHDFIGAYACWWRRPKGKTNFA